MFLTHLRHRNDFLGLSGIFYLVLLVFQLSVFQAFVFARQFSGIVVDTQGQPITNAHVRLQGTSFSTLTDRNGQFIMIVDEDMGPKYITSWKLGFYNGGQPVSTEDKEYRIELNPIRFADNKRYHWLSPLTDKKSTPTNTTGEPKPCQVCHSVIVEQWKKDAHSSSAANPLFLTLFNGTNAHGEKGAGPGYKLDFPHSNGNCATCHVPVLALDNPFNSNPNDAQGVAREGIFCDLCHKIYDVNIDETGGKPGILSIQFKRPPTGHQVFYGPYDDVFPGEDSYHPLYTRSQYCAPCHHGKFWDVLAYSEFQEWTRSSYAKKNIHCQDCHMKPDGRMARFALEEEGGVFRDPSTVPSHVNFGVRDRAFMMEAIALTTEASLKKDGLDVSVTVKNTNAGHHYPTGNPMRHMILLVEVTDEKGQTLPMTEGETVPEWGGVGPIEERNYAGLPGKGFAKVLKDVLVYPDRHRRRHFRYEYPAPHWRPTLVESDNRIPADGSDISNYQFIVPNNLCGSIHITTRLIFRRTYKKWMDAKELEIPDMEIARNSLIIGR
jgi:hypothetical protein